MDEKWLMQEFNEVVFKFKTQNGQQIEVDQDAWRNFVKSLMTLGSLNIKYDDAPPVDRIFLTKLTIALCEDSYKKTGNPLWVWDAIEKFSLFFCELTHETPPPLPRWIIEYLCAAAPKITKSSGNRKAEAIGKCLGFGKDSSGPDEAFSSYNNSARDALIFSEVLKLRNQSRDKIPLEEAFEKVAEKSAISDDAVKKIYYQQLRGRGLSQRKKIKSGKRLRK